MQFSVSLGPRNKAVKVLSVRANLVTDTFSANALAIAAARWLLGGVRSTRKRKEPVIRKFRVNVMRLSQFALWRRKQ